MPKRKTRSSCQSPEPEQDNDCKTGSGDTENNDRVLSRTRARRRLLCLNKIPYERSNSSIDVVKSYCKEPSFVTTGLKSVQTITKIENRPNCHETKINKEGNTPNSISININSTCEIRPVDTTEKQHNCNSKNNNSIPLNLRNYPKDKSVGLCNNAQDDGSSTGGISSNTIQVRAIAPIVEQLNNVDLYYSHWDSHVTKLPATTLVCGGGQENLSCQELDCEDEREPAMCTQDFLFGSSQNNNDLSEVQWDCRSPELVREVKQMQGLYGVEEIREVLSNFSDADVNLQEHTIPELKLYFPVKSDPLLARKNKHQKAKVRAGMRLQRKIYGRESAEAILQWLQNKAAVHLPGGALENTAALETLEAQRVCSFVPPSVSSEQDDLNISITDDVSQIPLEVDETDSCQSNSIITSCAGVRSLTGSQELHLSQEKTLNQIHTLSITDGVCEKMLGVDEVLHSKVSAVSILLSDPLRKTASVEAAMNSRQVQSVITPSVSTETEDGVFSDDDGFLQRVETLDHHYSTVSTSSSAAPRKPASVEGAMNVLHVQTALSANVSAAGDGTFSDDDDLLLEAEETLHDHCNILLTSAAAPGKPACLESTLNSLQVRSAITPSLSTETEDGVFSDDDGFLQGVETSDHYYGTVSMSSSAPRKLASMEAALNSGNVQTALTPNVSATEERAFSDDDGFLLEVEALDRHCDTIFTSSATPLRKPSPLEATVNSLHIQSAFTPSLTTTEQGAVDVSVSDDAFQQLLEDDKTSDIQANTVISLSSAPLKETAPVEAELGFNCLQSAITSSVSAIEDAAFNDSISDDDEFILEVDMTSDSQASTVFKSSTHSKSASLESTLNLLPTQSAMTLCLSATEDDAFNVDCDGFEETLDYQIGSASTSKPMTFDSLKTLHPNSDMTQGSSTTADTFTVHISDDEFHILEDDEETLDYQSGSIFTSKLGLCKETTGVLATLNSLNVQSRVIPGVSTTGDDGFDVSVSDDDLLVEVETLDRQTSAVTTLPSVEAALKPLYVQSHVTPGVFTIGNDGFDGSVSDDDLLVEVETLDRQTSAVTTLPSVEAALKPLYVQSHVTPGVFTIADDGFDGSVSDDDLLFEFEETLDKQANSISSLKAGLSEKTAPVCSMALQLESDNVCRKKDFDVIFPDDDSQLLLDSNEALDTRANISSTSGAISLQTTTAIKILLRTQHIQQSDLIERVSTIQEEFACFPDDDFEQMIEVGDSLAGQISILSSSTVDLRKKKTEVETLKTLQTHSDLIHSAPVTIYDTDFPDEDFDQMIEVGESLGKQIEIPSTSTPSDLCEITAEVETLETLPIHSDGIQNISMIENEDANFPDDDFEYLQELGESLGSQTNILSSPTPSELWDKTAEAEIWETLPIQSGTIQNMSLIQNEDVNFSDDDFEYLQDVNECLVNETNILSTSTPSDLREKNAAAESLLRQSDMNDNISMTQGEFVNLPDKDLIEVNETFTNQANILSTSPASTPVLSLYNETTQECKIFDTCRIHRPSVPNNDAIKKYLNESLHSRVGNIPLSVTLCNQPANIPTSMTLHNQPANIPTSVTLPNQPANITTSFTLHKQPVNIPTSITLHNQPANIPTLMTLHNQPANIPTLMTLHNQPANIRTSTTLHNQPANIPTLMTLHNQPANIRTSTTLHNQPANIPTSVTLHNQPANIPTSMTLHNQPANIPTLMTLHNQPANIPTLMTLHNQPANIPTLMTLHNQPTNIPTSVTLHNQLANIPKSMTLHNQLANIPTSMTLHNQPANIPTSMTLHNQPANICTSTTLHNQPTNIPTSVTLHNQLANIPTSMTLHNQLANIPTSLTLHNQVGCIPTSVNLQSQMGINSTSVTLHSQDGSILTSLTLHNQAVNIPLSITLHNQPANIPLLMTLHNQPANVPLSMTLHNQVGSIPSVTLHNHAGSIPPSMTLLNQDGSIPSPMTLLSQDGRIPSSMTLLNQDGSSFSSLALQRQDGHISTSVAAIPGGVHTPMSDNWKPSLSDTSLKTSQPSVKMNSSKSTNITDCGSNHDAFTPDNKQFCLSKLFSHLSSSPRAVNSTPTIVRSAKQFKFKRVRPLQMNSLPSVNLPSPFISHFSNLNSDVKWSNSHSCFPAEAIQHPAGNSACSQARCSPEEIEQKRRAALQKRSLRLSQFKHDMP